MSKAVVAAALLCAALGAAGCRTADRAPDCKGEYVPVNGAEHDRQEEGP